MGQVVKELPNDLADCKNMQGDVEKLKNWAQIFVHPKTLLPTLVENLMANWQTAFADVQKIQSDFSAASYYNSGEDVADLLVLAVGKPSQAPKLEDEVIFTIPEINMPEIQVPEIQMPEIKMPSMPENLSLF